MTKQAQPHWTLNDDWAIGTDSYNWKLYRRSGKGWRPIGYYPTPEMLLKSFHQKLTRVEPPQPTLEQYVEHCLERTQAAADRFLKCLATYPQSVLKAPPAGVNTAMTKVGVE